jgi:hypothetical protein
MKRAARKRFNDFTGDVVRAPDVREQPGHIEQIACSRLIVLKAPS